MSRQNYDAKSHKGSGPRLPGKYYHLRDPFSRKILRSVAFAFSLDPISGVFLRARMIEKIVALEKCRLLVVCTGDLFDLPAAFLASKATEVPLIVYLFDDYLYQWTGIRRTLAKCMEPAIIRHAAAVIVPNEFMQKEYERRYGVSGIIIRNPRPLPQNAVADKTVTLFNADEVNIIYAGAIYHAHFDAFRNLLVALRGLKKGNVKLHLFTAQPREFIEANGIVGDCVVYHDHVDSRKMPEILRQADILFLPLAFNSSIPEVISTSAPGKIAEYLSAGKPVLVHAPENTFVSWYFKKNRCGVVVDQNDPSSLMQALDRLILSRECQSEIGKRAKELAERDFDAGRMREKFVDLLDSAFTRAGQSCGSPRHKHL